AAHQESGLREIHLCRQGLHPAGLWEGSLGQRAHRRRVAGEGPVGESIDLEDFEYHGSSCRKRKLTPTAALAGRAPAVRVRPFGLDRARAVPCNNSGSPLAVLAKLKRA